jgi:predicted O-methyltransferase YrrM
MIDIASGHPAVDKYLTDLYARVPGMSSRFAAAICGHVIRRQSELRIAGNLLEIGTFRGRFFIAMALGLAAGEHAVGIDVFDWPDQHVLASLLDYCAAAGVPRERFTAWKTDSRAITADELREKLHGRNARFIHVDSHHTPECLRNDLELAHAVLDPAGVIALDDMLHPGYPTLIVTMLDYLARHPEMRLMCIIDRESITAAAKFLLCRSDAVARYEQDLMMSFARFHYALGGDMIGYMTLVLTPDPTLPAVS